jgi:hypothetical protein
MLMVADFRRLPLSSSCVDVLLADLPFGRIHALPDQNPLRAAMNAKRTKKSKKKNQKPTWEPETVNGAAAGEVRSGAAVGGVGDDLQKKWGGGDASHEGFVGMMTSFLDEAARVVRR